MPGFLPCFFLRPPLSDAAAAANACDGAELPPPPIVRERKAPIGMRLHREKSDRAEPGLGVAPSVAAPSASESDDDAAPSASTLSSSSSDSLRKSKSTLARTGEPTFELSAADSAPDVPDVVETRELARLRREGVESYCEGRRERSQPQSR